MAKFEKHRKPKNPHKAKDKVSENNHSPTSITKPGLSYRDGLEQKEYERKGHPHPGSSVSLDHSIKIRVDEDVCSRFSKCFVAEVRSFETLQNIWRVIREEGIHERRIRYIGGLSVLIECDSDLAAQTLIQNSSLGLTNWLYDIRLWREDMVGIGRLVWVVKLEGIPSYAWCEEVAKAVADHCGQVMTVEGNDPDCHTMHESYVLVHNSKMSIINCCLLE